ncbi:MAG: adenosylcobalamin-dependent ribonucleoside-diphosphate reductase [Thermoleophilaceae bacterium]|nr:adenosylcobalamin-dependent ribonucleoside-diphosphate reductase [Thermoleophilaceae bacterium]
MGTRAAARPGLVRRRLTSPARDPCEEIAWSRREVAFPAAGGAVSVEQVEAPAEWSPVAVATAAQRWMLREPEGRCERSVAELVRRVAGALGSWGLASGHLAGPEDAAALEAEVTALALGQRAMFATPLWLNAGTGEHPVTSACFILSVEDSLPALLEWNRREGLIFQQGAGAGVNLSAVRSADEPAGHGGFASGPISFMRAADAWAATIRSGGRARRGAKMVVLDADHPDVLDFIATKALEEERGRALHRAGWDVDELEHTLAFQQANHAVRVPDAFMRAALEDGDWELHTVTTGEVARRLPARQLLRACAEAAWRCGDPGLLFASTIDAWHTCPESGPIRASNPCGEYLHIEGSACNLATLNLLAFLSEDGGFDIEGFVHAAEVMLLAQDVIVSGSGYPAPDLERTTRAFRQVGLGFANLGATLLTLGLPYDSDRARAWAAAVAALLGGVAYRRSAELAAALGAFDEYERNREPMLAVVERHRAALAAIPAELAPRDILDAATVAWDEALALGRRHGFRNAQTTLIAPTGTVALVMDCETSGIEPYYALALVKQLADGGMVRQHSRALVDALIALGYHVHDVEVLARYADEHGHLAGAQGLRESDRRVFQTAAGPEPVPAAGHVGMVAAVQPFLSGGVSKTVNLPEAATVEEVEDVFVEAWRRGLKAISVYRQGSKLSQPLHAGAY